MKTQVIINNVIISKPISWESLETFGDVVRDISIQVSKSILVLIPTLTSGMTVTVKRGLVTGTEQFVFNGIIDSIKKSGPTLTILGKDQMIELTRKTVTFSYDGVAFPSTEAKGSDIVKDLIETFGGLTASVVDTGTTITLKKFICRGNSILSRIQVIADIYDYQVYYNPETDTVNFEPKGNVTASTALEVGTNIIGYPTWNFDNTQCVNKLIVKGAVQEVQDTESFNGDGSTTVFTLANSPIVASVVVDGADKVPGVEDSTSTFDYSIDKENKEIVFESGSIPPSGTNNVVVTYTRAIPVPVQVEDLTSQTQYGIYQAEKFFDDIQTVDDAESRGNGWLTRYSQPFAQTVIRVSFSLIDYNAGELVSVTDGINVEERNLVINRVKKRYPHQADILTLGDKEWKTAEWGKFTIERIRRLEEEIAGDTDVLVQVKSFPHTLALRKRYLRVIQEVPDKPNSFILSSPDAGILGTNKLGSTLTSTDNDFRITWPNQKYIETFVDTDFEGTGDATWNTTNKNLTFG